MAAKRQRLDVLLHRIAEGAVEAIYPRRCSGCGLRGVWVCNACVAVLPLFTPPFCNRCGMPETRGCRCISVPEDVDSLRSAGPYDGWLRAGVHRLKNQGESARAAHLSSLAVHLLDDFGSVEALVAVPLHPNRLKERGFNQSHLLARNLAEITLTPLWNGLSRTRDTPHQVDLPADEREANVKGAFAVRQGTSMRPSSVVLIDDVFTTGATVGECARSLKQFGVSRIHALTLC
ncbi:MAG: ComF family protein [Thermomicrobiales bacterium]